MINLKNIELWLHPKQKDSWISGHELYDYLKANDLLKDCLTLEDLLEIQKLGIKEFNKYFKNKWVYAWRGVRAVRVPYLIGSGGKVVLRWDWLGGYWRSLNPALRRKSSELKTSELFETLPFELIINGVKYIKS